MLTLLAQKINIGGSEIEGPLKLPGGQPVDGLGSIFSAFVSFLYPIAAVFLFFMLLWGGYTVMTSEGDSEKLGKGRKIITSSIIGFSLVAISYFLTRVISFVFGLGQGLFI